MPGPWMDIYIKSNMVTGLVEKVLGYALLFIMA